MWERSSGKKSIGKRGKEMLKGKAGHDREEKQHGAGMAEIDCLP